LKIIDVSSEIVLKKISSFCCVKHLPSAESKDRDFGQCSGVDVMLRTEAFDLIYSKKKRGGVAKPS
jgi:hypothetical protein